MEKPMFRWGILGAAHIARKNWKAIRNTGNGVITAVASRDAGRSRRFIGECQAEAPFEDAPRALGSYEALIATDDVDAVYIPLPTGIRKEWVLRAAAAGKHVVSEKPCAVTVADLVEMIDACRRHKVQFMDGVMFMHSRRLERIREVLNDGQTVGDIRRINSAFNFKAEEEFFSKNIRAHASLEPHGCLGDLGWYCIRLALWAMDWKSPRRATGRILSAVKQTDGLASVPTEFSGELFFDGGVSSSFHCSFINEFQQWAKIDGARGYLEMTDFVIPCQKDEIGFETGATAPNVEGSDFTVKPNPRHWTVHEHGTSHPDAQQTNLFRNFANQVQSGILNEAWPKMALQTQQVMHACLESSRRDGLMVSLGG